jgi:hypothetical protein
MRRKTVIIIVMVLFASLCGYAESLARLQDDVESFANRLAQSLPFNASAGLNWSDAYIGQITDDPRHFGAGAMGGFTTINSDAFKHILCDFGLSYPIKQMMVPVYTVEGRIGGFGIPFDIGLKFGGLPPVKFGDTLKYHYLLTGVDFRYAVLKGGIVLPKVSVGIGVNYLFGGLTAASLPTVSFDVNGDTLSLVKPDVTFSWQTISTEIKAQVSKSFLVITPYLGFGINYAWSRAGYAVKSPVQYNGNTISAGDTAHIKSYLKNTGAPEITSIASNRFATTMKKHGFGIRAFGGVSAHLSIVNFDLSLMYNFFDFNYGTTLGIRVQL